MTGKELFDLFMPYGAPVESVAAMVVGDLTQQIHEMRVVGSDDIPMGDIEVARAILDFAHTDREEFWCLRSPIARPDEYITAQVPDGGR